MFKMKNLFYFRSYLINFFRYKNIFIEFPVLKDHDIVTQWLYLTRDHVSKCDKSNYFKGVVSRLIKL